MTGEMLALMGPSGSGKTTLLNLIAGRTVGKTVKVEVSKHVNGTPLSSTAFRALSSYVEQEDALVGSLTVSETFHFAARMASDKCVPGWGPVQVPVLSQHAYAYVVTNLTCICPSPRSDYQIKLRETVL